MHSHAVWIVMQLCADRDLSSYLMCRTEPLPLTDKLWLCEQANRAILDLHSRNPPALHRDIKSDNFFLQASGTAITLGDFGRSKADKDGGTSVGTLRWTPPEILRNDGTEWTKASDIFALGMVLYHIITGHLPFGDDLEEEQVVQLVLSGERPQIPKDCPPVRFKFEIIYI